MRQGGMVNSENAGSGYQAYVDQSPVYRRMLTQGYLRLTGPDRMDFLQRQTTNDVRQLSENHVVVTVLTSPTARMLDVYTLLPEANAIGVLPLPGRAARAAEYLRSKVFFMDDVSVEDVSSGFVQFEVDGRGAARTLESIGVTQLPSLEGFSAAEVEGQPVTIIGQRGLSGRSYRLLAASSLSSQVVGSLESAGAAAMSAEGYQLLRVEVGRPSVDHELTEDYTPLEVGLDWAVSASKGCYTGQEIIARQITYDKVTRSLVGLRLDAPASVGDSIRVEDSAVGTLTSAAISPRFGPIGLAVVRRPHDEPGTAVSVQSTDGELRARVSSLPFA